MITFAFTPVGSSAKTTLTLLDSDRFWPAEMSISSSGDVQVSSPARGSGKVFFGRGLKSFELNFTATRQHANLFAAVKYVLEQVPTMNGALGLLTISMPGGGTLRAQNCVCSAASGNYNGVRSYCVFTFAGPSIGP